MLPADIIVIPELANKNAVDLYSSVDAIPGAVVQMDGASEQDWAQTFHGWMSEAARLLTIHSGEVRGLVQQNADALKTAADWFVDHDQISQAQAENVGEILDKTVGTDPDSGDPSSRSTPGARPATVPSSGPTPAHSASTSSTSTTSSGGSGSY